jgi:hypothetical protein
MEQRIGLERLYTLGQYKNIKILDTITEIPQELMLDNDAQSLLRMLQFIRVDRGYLEYRKLADEVFAMNTEDALSLLDNLEKDTINSLQEILKNGNLETKKEKEEMEV